VSAAIKPALTFPTSFGDTLIFDCEIAQTEEVARHIRTSERTPEVARRIASSLSQHEPGVAGFIFGWLHGYKWPDSPDRVAILGIYPTVLAAVTYEEAGIEGLADLLQSPKPDVRLAAMVRLADVQVAS
jgi:hypothetical protein